jgi:putative MATE family efflux protein
LANIKLDDLGTKNLNSLLTKLSLPAMIGMFSIGLYNIVDAIFIGYGVGTLALGGLAIVFPLHILVLSICHLVSIGSASIISRCFGSKDYEKAHLTAGNAFFIVTIFGFLFSFLAFVFIDQILVVFGATKTLLPYSREYLRVLLIGIPFFSFAVTGNNIIRAEGKAKTAMIAMLIGTIINIILDPIFIFGFKLGLGGAALATVISHIVGFLYIFIFYITGKSEIKLKLKYFILDKIILVEMFSIGFAPFIRQVGTAVLAVVVNHSLRIYGSDLTISIWSIINRTYAFIGMPLFGIVQGLQPIVGYNYGSHQFSRVTEALKKAIIVATCFSLVFYSFIMMFPAVLLRVFTSDMNLVNSGILPLRLILLAFPLIGFQMIGASFFQAIGKVAPSIFLTMSRQIIFLIPFLLVLPLMLGILGIWIAFPLADVLATIITSYFVIREVKILKRAV